MMKSKRGSQKKNDPSSNKKTKIGISEFKAQCLQLIEETRQKGKEWTITKKGEAVAQVVPIRSFRKTLRGSLKGLGEIRGDIVHHTFEDDWEVYKK